MIKNILVVLSTCFHTIKNIFIYITFLSYDYIYSLSENIDIKLMLKQNVYILKIESRYKSNQFNIFFLISIQKQHFKTCI